MRKKFISVLAVAAIVAVTVFFWSCSKDSNPTAPNNNNQTDQASGTVRSDTSGVITTPQGARIVVPQGAVPRMSNGNVGAMVFSIERTTQQPPALPTGQTANSAVYRFGPEGFILARPVEISVPVTGTEDPGNVAIYRINPTTGSIEFFGGHYDSTRHVMTAQTYEFSSWFTARYEVPVTGWGALNCNNMGNKWVSVCAVADDVQFTYPELDGPLVPADGLSSTWAATGDMGWGNQGLWYLPQGTYRMCITYCLTTQPYFTWAHVFRDNVVVNQVWDRVHNPLGIPFDIPEYVPGSGDSDRCVCIPTPTPSVGTGDIQVTLTWFNATPGIDVDLYVIEPGRRDSVCYFRTETESGGTLDLDNRCGNYVNGRPENIFWTRTPPNGTYLVRVNYFGSCGLDTVQTYSVRTVVKGTTRTFNGVVSAGHLWENVTSFDITGSEVNFVPVEPNYLENLHVALPPKQ